MLSDFVTWKSLKYSNEYASKKKYHYKTINNVHLLWSKMGIYKKAYDEITQNNSLCNITKNLYIDATLIINKSGIENIGFGCGESRKKKFTSLTAVCNENTKPVIIFPNISNKKTIEHNNKEININTLPHDSKGIIQAINKIKTLNKYNLIGDAGYIYDNNKINNDNVCLITNKRKNMKNQNNCEEKILLKKRYKIENLFAKIKSFNRIHVRRDKLIHSYMSFVYLACICKI